MEIYGLDYIWHKTNLTWCFENTKDNPELSQAEAETKFQEACNQWAAVIGRTFTKGQDPQKADIRLVWDSIDGAGSRAAQTTMLGKNDTQVTITFDTAEQWTRNGLVFTASNFSAVALHEIGHAIGLKHSAYDNSVMYKEVLAPFPRQLLNDEDKMAASYLYGNRSGMILVVNESPCDITSVSTYNNSDPIRGVFTLWPNFSVGKHSSKLVMESPVGQGLYAMIFLGETRRGNNMVMQAKWLENIPQSAIIRIFPPSFDDEPSGDVMEVALAEAKDLTSPRIVD